ncbi:unnamed protein product [Heligmosomoides polygyrus]|uniref:Uncharacterized protein n=1 Tax=Heligmosomoides polygyrus TaxID=6339 RepID=A0A183FZU0_HELPZ|nr:unnamed protein product [Heligmosomoides polygyrus]
MAEKLGQVLADSCCASKQNTAPGRKVNNRTRRAESTAGAEPRRSVGRTDGPRRSCRIPSSSFSSFFIHAHLGSGGGRGSARNDSCRPRLHCEEDFCGEKERRTGQEKCDIRPPSAESSLFESYI